MLRGIINPAPANANSNIEIYLDDQKIDIVESPIIINGRVPRPMRTLFDMFYLDVHWDHEEMTVEATVGDRKIRIQIGMHLRLTS